MATLAQLDAARATAGARYAAAAAEIHAALVDLAALDRIANNGLAQLQNTPTPTFNDPPDSLPWPFCHPTFVPHAPLPNWRDQIAAAYTAYTTGAGAWASLFGPTDPPIIGTATAIPGSANKGYTLTFTPAAMDPRRPISFRAFVAYAQAGSGPLVFAGSSGGGSSGLGASPITINGSTLSPPLASGVAVTFVVQEQNTLGVTASSAASNSVTPG